MTFAGFQALFEQAAAREPSTSLQLADIDAFLDQIMTQGREPGYLLVSPERYQQIMHVQRRAKKRHWQLSQKWRAETRRTHRERKRAHAALALQYRRRTP